jgi:hypothetical protein
MAADRSTGLNKQGVELVAGNDPWLANAWKVYAVQGAEGSHLKPAGKEGAFTLTAVADPVSGGTAYYTMNFADGEMPPCWRGLLLYPRGNLRFAPPAPPLHTWTPGGNAPWLAAADAVRQGLNVAMARLEGDLYPDGNGRALTMVCIPNATITGTPLLVLKLVKPTPPGQVVPLDTPVGGGHGDN